MVIKELLEKIEQIKKENPDLDIDNMEIGSIFYSGLDNVIVMVRDIYLLDEGAWERSEINGEKAIGIEWHC